MTDRVIYGYVLNIGDTFFCDGCGVQVSPIIPFCEGIEREAYEKDGIALEHLTCGRCGQVFLIEYVYDAEMNITIADMGMINRSNKLYLKSREN